MHAGTADAQATAATIWIASHTWTITWSMLIYQISLLGIMGFSIIMAGNYIWKSLKKVDKENEN